MNILDFSDKELIVLGDLHGEFNQLINTLTQTQKNFKANLENEGNKKKRKRKEYLDTRNKVFVISGDCGVGFNKLEYYILTLKRLNDFLVETNSIVVGVRGNHDDPEYFNTDKYKLGFSNIVLVPDYTVIKSAYNTTLCVGGGVSEDRAWRMHEHERRMRYNKANFKKIYWNDEVVQPNENILSELKSEGIKIDSIITHVMPLDIFFKEKNKVGNELAIWTQEDDSLVEDLRNQSEILYNLYQTLISDGHEIKWWACGHYHCSQMDLIPDSHTTIVVLSILRNCDLFNAKPFGTSSNGYVSTFYLNSKEALANIDELRMNEGLVDFDSFEGPF